MLPYSVGSSLIVLVVWLATRGGARSAQWLVILESALCAAVVVAGAIIGTTEHGGMAGVFFSVLALSFVVIPRALALPSTPYRTARIGLLLWLLAGLAAWYAQTSLQHPPDPENIPLGSLLLRQGLISAIPLAISVFASKLLYGLRTQIKDALKLGQYTLESKIGEGGMGVVYRARHALLRRPTAIKLLQPERSSPIDITRFEREVQFTAGLGHPNTVRIYDYGRTADGIFYYAMEWIEGADLRKIVDEAGPLPPARAVHLLVQVLNALVEAHEAGLIHRDIKPANVLVVGTPALADLAKLADFGLVRSIIPTAEVRADATIDGTVIGSPHFMSPEAIERPEAVDARSDLYSLGVLAYFLLSGERVFSGPAITVCHHHLSTPPEPLSQRARQPIPRDLEQAIMSCLAKNPVDRPPSAAVLRDQLLQCESVSRWTVNEAREWWKRQSSALTNKSPSQTRRSEEKTRTVQQ